MYTRLVAALFGLAIGLPVASAQEQETWSSEIPSFYHMESIRQNPS